MDGTQPAPTDALATELDEFALYAERPTPEHSVPEKTLRSGDTLMLQNVDQPTLRAFLPAPSRATGAGVIVAPGGGFMTLSIETEGAMVARALADRGIAAFVLKYRLEQTPEDQTALIEFATARIRGHMAARQSATAEAPYYSAYPPAVRDAGEAVRLLRSRAHEWGVDPARLGFLGFSAGAGLATEIATGDASTRPDFVGIIYGALERAVPADAPPAFIASAADDPLIGPEVSISIFNAWRAAARSAELHIFERGGHGYGAVARGASSDHWFDQFVWWMGSRGFIEADDREQGKGT